MMGMGQSCMRLTRRGHSGKECNKGTSVVVLTHALLTTKGPMSDEIKTDANTTATSATSSSSTESQSQNPRLERYFRAVEHIDTVKEARKAWKVQSGRELVLSAEEHWELIDSYEARRRGHYELMAWAAGGLLACGIAYVSVAIPGFLIKAIYNGVARRQGRPQGHQLGSKVNPQSPTRQADAAWVKRALLRRNGELDSKLAERRVSALRPTTRWSPPCSHGHVGSDIKTVAAEGCKPSCHFRPLEDASKPKEPCSDTDPVADALVSYSASLVSKVRRGASALRESEQDDERDGKGPQINAEEAKKNAGGK